MSILLIDSNILIHLFNCYDLPKCDRRLLLIDNLSENEQRKVLDLINLVQQQNVKSENQQWSEFSLEQAMRGLENDLIPEYTEADLIEKWQ